MKIGDVKRILVMGAGTMGHQIGLLCAVHGYEAVIYDSCPDIFEKVRDRLDKLADKFIRKGSLPSDGKKGVLERIFLTSRLDEVARDIDLVSESIPEDPCLKAEAFSKLNSLCPERTIFTTNTSMLLPSMFAEATGRPGKFLALHFHDVVLAKVVDIMPHPLTAKETIDLVDAFARSLEQIVILMKKESSAYVFNAMLGGLWRSALALAVNDVASVEEIDRAWMGVMNTAAGPFGIMDSVGLDTVWKILDYNAGRSEKKQLRANADFVKSYLDQGKFGIKSGEGFYRYPNPLFRQPGFLGSSSHGSGLASE